MIFIVGGLCLILGAFIGAKAVIYIFSKMADQGNLVFKDLDDGKWVGEPEALHEIKIKEWLKKPNA